MPKQILVVDDKASIEPIIDRAMQESVRAGALKVVGVESPALAKRRMVAESPDLIFARVRLGMEDDAGIKFCIELKGHETLSSIPVVLVADTVTDELIRSSNEVGAKGLIPWPFGVEPLRHRILALLPMLETVPSAPVSAPKKAPSAKDTSVQVSVSPEMESKLKIAQGLLAKVLHALKTSDLLQVVEAEDVPSVVYEMTRKVCGMESERKPQVNSSAKTSAKSPVPGASDGETTLNLDQIFGPQKRK